MSCILRCLGILLMHYLHVRNTSSSSLHLPLDEALDQLAADDPLGANLVRLKFFAGLTLREAAVTLGVPTRTADRHWAYARAWLYSTLDESAAGRTGQEP